MSREVRRVPLDFDAPLGEVWAGYLRPDQLDSNPCPDCWQGATWAAAWVYTLSTRIAFVAADIVDQRRGRPMHPWLANDDYPPLDDRRQAGRPSEDILQLIARLTGRDETELLDPLHSPFGDGGRIAGKLIEAAGLDPQEWGVCTTCGGAGGVEVYPGQRAAAEAWEATEPPAGDGYQLWSTACDGAPLSPVFATSEELAGWMVRAGEASSDDVARRFIEAGWAPSNVGTPDGQIVGGVEFIGGRHA